MTRRITIDAGRPYDVTIGAGARDELLRAVGDDALRIAVIHPPTLTEMLESLVQPLRNAGRQVTSIEVPDSEAAKTADVLATCWARLGEEGFTRSDVVVGLGGGATTDLAGLVAATWLRGVAFVNVPTTVLGMVDAAVGGKTGINTPHGKNLVGAFHEPAAVLCDLDVLGSLPMAELRSGMAEILKCGFIADTGTSTGILDLFEADPAAALDPTSPLLAELIARGIEVKAHAVSGDLRETSGSAGLVPGPHRSGTGIGREAVNYGHTLGHAIEIVRRHQIRHGEAISIGMVFVAELARRSGLIGAELLDRHRSVLTAAGLPVTWDKSSSSDWNDLLAAMRLDKKSRGAQLRFVVLEDLGRPGILAGPDEALLADCFRAVTA
ncbi:3-dehydroquinate synthase [Aeromicrobium sp. CF3.5]|uniref:3-dehydroquinate synthase n=1 Tax=Aeromicrobium sp. CF3.5 TaxID=3373078 RepID=UPI003EE6B345